MITLAIDTSTTRGGVALLVDGILQLDESFVADRSHSASLFSVLERARALIPGQRLDQMAIGLGPGSYAGVRIAIAAAIGFEFGLGALLLGIPSAAALETEAPHYLAIGDARRETFYFTRVEDGACLEGPLLATESELRARLAGRPDLPVFTSVPIPEFPDALIALPSAAKIARIAATGIGSPVTGDLEPIYLREPHITKPKTIF
jgi:tRNA threonylcarbamoyladenosine biosynthesis protein TsaB